MQCSILENKKKKKNTTTHRRFDKSYTWRLSYILSQPINKTWICTEKVLCAELLLILSILIPIVHLPAFFRSASGWQTCGCHRWIGKSGG